MNATSLFAALILAGAALNAAAQTSPTVDPARPSTDPTQPTARQSPPPADTAAPIPQTAEQAKQDLNQQKTDPLALQSSAAQDWDMLTGHDKGYVTLSDALPNSWLATNFANCDKDQDGKVTQPEYSGCRNRKE